MHVFFSIFPCLTHTTEVVSTFSSLTGWAVLLFLSPCCLIGINRDLIVLFHISSPSFKQTKSCVHEKKHWHTTKKKKNIVKLSPPFQKPSSCHWVSTNNKTRKTGIITSPTQTRHMFAEGYHSKSPYVYIKFDPFKIWIQFNDVW